MRHHTTRPSVVPVALGLTCLVGVGPPPAAAQDAAPAERVPPAMRGIDVVEHPGAKLPLDRPMIDEDGRRVRLGRFFRDAGEPVLLVPGYFRCRMLCGVLAPQLARALERVDGWTPGTDYRVVLFSIDPREGPDDAKARRAQALGEGGAGWTLLTGPEASVRAIADAVGFEYRYDEATDQFAHAALTVAVAPDGTVARYLYGVRPDPADLADALTAAREHRSAGSLERVLMLCFRYTPSLRRHAGLIANALRGGAVLILVGLAGVFVLTARRAARAETES